MLTARMFAAFAAASNQLDPDARLLIDAVEGGGDVVTPLQRKKLNTLFRGLKQAGIYTKIMAMYPFFALPATGTGRRWNAVDPRDLDAAYRLSFIGSPTHTADSVGWNGTNQYARTFLNLSALALNNRSSGAWLSTDSSTAGHPWAFGVGAGAQYFGLKIRQFRILASGLNNLNNISVDVSQGLISVDTSTGDIYRNGVSVYSDTPGTVGPTAGDIFIGCVNNGSGTPTLYAQISTPFFFAGVGLSAPEHAQLYSIIQSAMLLT